MLQNYTILSRAHCKTRKPSLKINYDHKVKKPNKMCKSRINMLIFALKLLQELLKHGITHKNHSSHLCVSPYNYFSGIFYSTLNTKQGK